MGSTADVAVIGAGIAGTSIAAALSVSAKVLLLEAETHPGYHSTGRSAALFTEHYGNAAVRALTRAARPFFENPPGDYSRSPLLRPRPALWIAREDQLASLQELAELEGPFTRRISPREAAVLCPVLDGDYVAGAHLEPRACDVDVHELQQLYLRQLKAQGGALLTDRRVERLVREGQDWAVWANDERHVVRVVVNAAGAWAEDVAALAGAAPIGLTPRRRTAVLLDAPAGSDVASWPMVVDVDEQFYFKPEAGLVMVSPGDETPVEPSDVQPDEWDVAVAVDRYMAATGQTVRHVRKRWAGLRSFVSDRSPVVGFDPAVEGFFWCAALGGYGIQTAPAVASLCAALIEGRGLPRPLATAGVRLGDLDPCRLRA